LEESKLYGGLLAGQKNITADISSTGRFILKLGDVKDLWLVLV
jgi:hypothetical protein